jgi:hypothetical protein
MLPNLFLASHFGEQMFPLTLILLYFQQEVKMLVSIKRNVIVCAKYCSGYVRRAPDFQLHSAVEIICLIFEAFNA